MAAPQAGVCGPWIEPEDVLACCGGLTANPSTTQIQKAIDFAQNILFRLSGRQYPGLCTRLVRPCFGNNCGCGGGQGYLQWPMGGWSHWVWDQSAAGWAFPSLPYRVDGEWFNSGQGGCGGTCSLEAVPVPAPISNLVQVVVDGVVLDPSACKVQQFAEVVRVDGGHWPCTNNRAIDSSPYTGVNDGSKAGTWQIEYQYGRGPGRDGEIACARFACEIAKYLCQAAECNLPQRVRNVVREGVTLDFVDPISFLSPGAGGALTGIYEVDLWIKSVNPDGVPRRATIRRLDKPPRYQGFT